MTANEYQPDYPFISQNVLERLISGDFKPVRSKKSMLTFADRRDRVSPLGVIKRAIRYEPNVFINRRQQVFDIATTLNSSDFKITALYGPEGIGKTALARAVVEMMGGTPAQLLWFDGSPLTDIEQMSRFCVEYLLYICRSLRPDMQFKEALNPRDTLRILLSQIPDIPILLVIDNIELYVADDLTWRAPELKEMLQYLLEFENIKVLLLGQKLPEADLRQLNYYLPIPVPALSDHAIQQLLTEHFPQWSQTPNISILQGNPEWFWAWAQLQQHSNLSTPPANQSAPQFLSNLFNAQCSQQEKTTAYLLAITRHGVHQAAFDIFVETINSFIPNDTDNSNALVNGAEFSQSVLRWISKKAYSPQAVLGYVRQRLGMTDDKVTDTKSIENKAIEPYYVIISDIGKTLIEHADPLLLSRLHQALAQFYDAEQQRPIHQRIFPMKTRFLTSEAEHHRKMAKSVFTKPSERHEATAINNSEPAPITVHQTVKPASNQKTDDPTIEGTSVVIQKQKLQQRVSYYQNENNDHTEGDTQQNESVETTLEHYYVEGINAFDAGKLNNAKTALQHWLAIEAITRKTNPEKLFNALVILSQISLNFSDPTRCQYYFRKAESIQNRIKNPLLKIKYYFNLAEYWQTQKEAKLAIKVLTKSIRLAQKEHIQDALAKGYQQYGQILLGTPHVFWAVKALVFSAEQFEQLHEYKQAIHIWLYLANLQQDSGAQEMIILNLQQALKLAKASGDKNLIEACSNRLIQLSAQNESTH